ncbi:hypothetical protein Celaphus_00008131, partial [Cervus elaphus hippelaphus]
WCAICFSLAASALPGWSRLKVTVLRKSELPLLVEDDVEGDERRKGAVWLLQKHERWQSQTGKPWCANGRGPGISYHWEDGIKALRNIAGSLILPSLHKGITLLNVDKLNVLKLPPGGHRFEFAFSK